jgi:hypothetical protein
MDADEDEYIVIPDPNNPSESIRAKLLKYEKIKGEDHEYRLNDKTKIKLILDVDSISRPIDPKTNKPAVNPTTGEPVINISWGVRVRTIYSEAALNEYKGRVDR